MKLITPFDPSIANSGSFDPLVSNPCGRIILYNETAYGITLTFQNGNVQGLPPFYYRSYVVDKPGKVDWAQNYNIVTTGSSSFKVFGESYESAEVKGLPLAEGPLNRQTNIGNSIPVSTTANSIQNDGNAASTSIVEATQAGASSSNVSIDNSGNVAIKEWVSSTLTALLQLYAGGNTSILSGINLGVVLGSNSPQRGVYHQGDTYYNGRLGVAASGDTLDSSGFDTYLNARGGANVVHISSGGTENAAFDQNGIHLSRGRLSLISGTNTHWGSAGFSGSGTINHGCGAQPDIVLPSTHINGSQTVGYDSENSTTVHITAGAGLQGVAYSIKYG